MVRKGTVGQVTETSGQLEIEWQIADFISLTSEINTRLYSPMYFLSDSSWYLQVYVGTVGNKEKDDVTPIIKVYLVRGDSGAPKSVIFSLFLKTSDGKETIVNTDEKIFDKIDKGWGAGPQNLTRCNMMELKSKFMPSGALTILCSLRCKDKRVLRAEEMLKEVMKVYIDSTDAETQTHATDIEKLLVDLKSLINSGDHTDVTVIVQDEEFRLHRAILGVRAPVFNATLKDELKGKTTGFIPVDDIEIDTFRTFIHYLYTGSSDLLSSENVLSLLRIADKYEVSSLKESCLVIVKRMPLTVDTFVDTVNLALKHEDEELMELASTFLSQNMIEVMNSEKWLIFLENNLKQANELVVQAAIRAIRKEESHSA